MRSVPTIRLKEDSELALDVLGETGEMIFPRGTRLTKAQLGKLKDEKVASVYITDEYCFTAANPKYIADSGHMMNKIATLKKMIAITAVGLATNEALIGTIELVNEIVQYYYTNRNELDIVYEDAKIEGNATEEKIVYIAMISTLFALKLGLNPRATAAVCLAALLKDVSLVTPNIKWISGENNKHHPKKSYEYLKEKYNLPEDVLGIILAHEELYDGSGYPNRLKGETIPKGARIISIIESYYNIKQQLKEHCLTLEADFVKKTLSLDPHYLEIFRENTNVYEPDTLVELTSGDIAVVTEESSINIFQPNVRIVKSVNYPKDSEICLAKMFNVNIQKIVFYVE